MKIRMLTQEFLPYEGGVATYTHGLATAAAVAGHDVVVRAPKYDGTPASDAALAYRVERYPGGLYTHMAFPGLLMRALAWIRSEPDAVFHAIDWPWAEALFILRKFKRFQYWATLHGTDVLSMAVIPYARYLGVKNPYLIADHLLANSEATMALYEERAVRFPPNQQRRVTLLGVEAFWFDAADPNLLETVLPDIVEQDLLLVSVGRLEPRKGHRLVLQALKRLPEALAARVVYVVVGRDIEDDYVAELRALAESSPARVRFVGTLDRDTLRALYRRADVFTLPGEPHPGRVEGFGLVFLEAAAQETPSVASALGGIPEAIADRSTGLVVPPGDLRRYTEALEALLASPDIRQAYGKAARLRAATFTWDRCSVVSYGPTMAMGRREGQNVAD
jgi:glycosyltransferase involved in cell wall biosynthesis